VSQWRTNGVPRDRLRAVSEFTAGEVSLEDMIPFAADSRDEAKAA
jgi:hypothetical protein